jgi:uncharacterized membrane protein
MKQSSFFLRFSSAFVFFVVTTQFTHAQTITTYDAPNSGNTILVAINSAGQIAGTYNKGHEFFDVGHGFLREANGTFTAFDVRGATGGLPTRVTGMNDSGEVIGLFIPWAGHSSQGFFRQADGTIGPPCVSWSAKASAAVAPLLALNVYGNAPQAINGIGQIVGVSGANDYVSYLRQPDGTCVTIELGNRATYALAINVFGEITGTYMDVDRDFVWRGFLRDAKGQITTFDAPGSLRTEPTAIDQKGHIAGNYTAADGDHGFLRKPNGQIETFDPFGSVKTIVMAMNQKGQITGYYATTDGVYHGFLRDKNGEIETFDALEGNTFPQDINDLGEIVGYYQDANSAPHGFIRSNDKEPKGHFRR